MPVKIEKIGGPKAKRGTKRRQLHASADNLYKVSTPGGTKSKGTSLKNAKAQERIINAVEHSDWRPGGKKKTSLLG